MKIFNKGRGVHEREVKGIERLQNSLPGHWYAFTNLEIALPYGGREIDVILVIEDRIVAVDLKDWRGKIESEGGGWSNAGKPQEGGSPVAKIIQNAREVKIFLERFLKSQNAKGKRLPCQTVPKVDGCVVLTATTDKSGIVSTELDRVFTIDEFISAVSTTKSRIATLGGVAPDFHKGIVSEDWRTHLMQFFNVQEGNFRVSSRQYGSYKALSDSPCFTHPAEVYSEFDVMDRSANNASGLLRRWDYTKVETRYQNENARKEIAGRERVVIAWLNDRNAEFEGLLLQPRVDDPEKGVGYWEVFDRRKRLKRLIDLSAEELAKIPRGMKLDLIRQVLSTVKSFHDLGVSHSDLGLHSIWLELPSLVRISHFLAARYPEFQTLGASRFQFLASVSVPEDVFGVDVSGPTRDVFLLGSVAHFVLFGQLPKSEPGQPAEWTPEADSEQLFEDLHSWFECALAWEANDRFRTAGEMLAKLNAVTLQEPSAKAVLEGLERFRTVGTVFGVLKKYPLIQEIQDDSRVTIWVSESEGARVIVKMWKREGWGDQREEAPRILAFLERARALQVEHPAGCAKFVEVLWTGDSIVLVSEFIGGLTLTEALLPASSVFSQEIAGDIAESLVRTIARMHENGQAHGDIKPDNVILQPVDEEYAPVLIDLLDFSPVGEGERTTSAFSPPEGGRFERDCYATTVLVESILRAAGLNETVEPGIFQGITTVRTAEPKNATVLPLLEALSAARSGSSKPPQRILKLAIRDISTDKFFSDEGKIGVRVTKFGRQLRLRGAAEEVVIELNEFLLPTSGRRETLEQKGISRLVAREFMQIDAEITFTDEEPWSLLSIETLIAEPAVTAHLTRARQTGSPGESADPAIDDEITEQDSTLSLEMEEDSLSERISAEPPQAEAIDVPALWKKLLDVEAEMTVSGFAAAASGFQKSSQRHLVPFQIETGTFDFSKDDTVSVMRRDKKDRWVSVGRLDTPRSSQSQLFFEFRGGTNSRESLIAEGQGIRLDSHFELTSRARRVDATAKILGRQARIEDLIDVFHPDAEALSVTAPYEVDKEFIRTTYALNDLQAIAFERILAVRPVGLLQGPPGTGKTRFIAALIHYVLERGIARNILLASQSHEAVNGAAETVLSLFQSAGEAPSILRIGHESNVSDPLLPYHVAKQEALYKDRFRAELDLRLNIVAENIGLPAQVRDLLVRLHVVVAPVVEKILILENGKQDQEIQTRVQSTRETLRVLLEEVGVRFDPSAELDNDFLGIVSEEIAEAHGYSNFAAIRRFEHVVLLARDFMGSVSTWQRSLESFLAGTRQIVVGTCVGLGRSTLGLTSTAFDLVIVDEAARCTASELAVPLQCGRWVVLVGDQAQLEPQHRAEVVAEVSKSLGIHEREIVRSDFERAFDSDYGKTAGVRLGKQYRMLPAIGALVSGAFYDGLLIHGREELIIPTDCLPELLTHPLVWLTTDSFGETAAQKRALTHKGERETSLCNPVEADLIVDAIRDWDQDEEFRAWLEQQTVHQYAIGIICTYRAQSTLVENKLRSVFLTETMRRTIKVDTVDSYQGKENLIVLLSLVRNNTEGARSATGRLIQEGFMARANRLNVAISRARERLVIVGASQRWRREGPMGKVLKAFEEQRDVDQALFVDGAVFRSLLDTQAQGNKPKGKKRKKSAAELPSEVGNR